MTFLSDTDLQAAIDAAGLIQGASEDNARHCSYEFTAGKIFPGEDDDGQAPKDWTGDLLGDEVFCLKPGALAWIRMRESVHMPDDRCGLWVQTNRLSRKGVLLVNMCSLVDPGYRGPVAGTFVNFGRHSVQIRPKEPLAKLLVGQLSSPSARPFDNLTMPKNYDGMVHDFAIQGPATFLDLEAMSAKLQLEKQEAMLALAAEADAKKKEISSAEPWRAIGFAVVGFVILVAATSFVPWAQAQLTPSLDNRIESVVERELADRIAIGAGSTVSPTPGASDAP